MIAFIDGLNKSNSNLTDIFVSNFFVKEELNGNPEDSITK
jgi:hypothetical protein